MGVQPINTMEKGIAMEREYTPEREFFSKLLDVIVRNTDRVPPKNLTKDICAGFRYALSILEEKEAMFLRLRYQEGKEPKEICAEFSIPTTQVLAFEERVIQKLRAPCRWNYIKLGVVGYLQAAKADSETCGYKKGYAEGYKNGAYDTEHGVVPNGGHEDLLEQPVETMGLSARALHCVQIYKCERIGDVVRIPDETIRRMRGLGKTSADEIARELQAYGIESTDWYSYLL